MWHHILHIPCSIKVTPCTFRIQASHSVLPCTPRRLQPLKATLFLMQTTCTRCVDRSTATLTISKSNCVRQIHFGCFRFFSFSDALWGSCYGDRIQRQLWQPMHTRVGRALRLCVCVCVCVLHNASDTALKGIVMICQRSAGSDVWFIACWDILISVCNDLSVLAKVSISNNMSIQSLITVKYEIN